MDITIGLPNTVAGVTRDSLLESATAAGFGLPEEAYVWSMHRDTGWQLGAWAGSVCVLLAANGLAHESTDQALIFFGAAVFLFLWAALLARARH